MVFSPIEYNILGINVEWIFLFILIVLGIILIKNRNILKPNKRKFILFLALFIFLSFMPILDYYHSHYPWINISSLYQSFITFLNYKISGPPCGASYVGLHGVTCYNSSFLDRYGEALIRFISLLIIISYIFSCLMISVYDKFKIKKIK